jgi:peptidoglycan/xylan/chitin deacetylase (PgdA/CDA1 family)
MYHRIADMETDPWELAVSPRNFEEHLKILRKKYKVISVAELVNCLEKKSIPPNSVCITFDDGYLDNFSAAKPLLEKYESPATFFISTYYIERQKSFWWDELERMILGSQKLPAAFSMQIGEESFEFHLYDEEILTDEIRAKQKKWVWTEKPPTRRGELYLALHRRLKPLPHEDLRSVMKEIKRWSGYENASKGDSPMRFEHLKKLSSEPLFEIGLHTVNHSALSFHSRETQSREIADNDKALKTNCEKVARMLAFPYGNYDETTISVVRERELKAAFTTSEKPVTKNSDPFQLSRFQVKNWNAEEFEERLSGWSGNY